MTNQEIKQAEKVCIDSLRSALGIVTNTVVKNAKCLVLFDCPDGDFEKVNWRIEEKWKDLRRAKELLPGERIGICQRAMAFKSITANLEAGGGEARYKGLASCGGVWGCPVCAPRKASVRQVELKQGLENHKGASWLLTLTMKHHRFENIGETIASFKRAMR